MRRRRTNSSSTQEVPWWRRVKLWQLVLAPAVTASVIALVTAGITKLVTSDPKPTPVLAAPLVARNPPVAGEDAGDDTERQTNASKPVVELTVRNTGDARAVLHGATFTVRDHGVLANCQGAGACSKFQQSTTSYSPFDRDSARRSRLRSATNSGLIKPIASHSEVGNPELGPADTGGFVYLLDVALIHGLAEESIDAGTVLLSLPGTPRLEVVGPGVDADTDCVQHNRALLERLARGEVTLSPNLTSWPPISPVEWSVRPAARERSRQPEPWEHAVLEAGHGADPVAGEGEDEEADAVADAGRARAGRPRTPADRWLASARGRTSGPAPKMLAQKRATTSRPSYSKGIGGIEIEDVVGQQGHQRVEIGGLVRAGRTSPRSPPRRVSRERAAVRARLPAAGGAAGWRAPV